MEKQNVLVGKTVTAVYLADDGGAIKFEVDEGEPIIARADGDCCSRSWIENVEAPERIIGKPILVADDINLDKPDVDSGDEYVRFYGFKIITANGETIIDYRNSSNGYYGGNLSWPDDDYFYGGVFGQNNSTEKWKKIAG